jgi:hypothetical protein
MYGRGISRAGEVLDLAVENGIVSKKVDHGLAMMEQN